MKIPIKFLALLIPLGASGQFINETESNWRGSDYTQRFGGAKLVTDGQLFREGGLKLSLNVMENYLPQYKYPYGIEYSVYLTAWADTLQMASGSILLEIRQRALAPESDWAAFSLMPGGKRLDLMEPSAVFLDVPNQLVGVFGNAKSRGVTGESQSIDRLINMGNGTNLDVLFESSWSASSVSE